MQTCDYGEEVTLRESTYRLYSKLLIQRVMERASS